MSGFRRLFVALVIAFSGLVLASCSTGPKTPRSEVQDWNTEVGLVAIDQQLDSDLTFLQQAARTHNFGDLQTNCDGFPGDVESLYETLPAPITALTNDFNNATQSWNSAARACVDASGFKTSLYRSYEKDLAAGNRSYAEAEKLLAYYGVG